MIEEMQLKAGADRKSPEPAQQPTGRISPSKTPLAATVITFKIFEMSAHPVTSPTSAPVKKTPDADYLKSDELGLVIAKGMAVLYKTNPKNPVDFLGKWLLNVSQVQKSAAEQKNAQNIVNQHITAHKKELQRQEEEQEKLNEKKQQVEKTIHDFNDKVDHSDDLNDMLPELNGLLKAHTNSTAAYIGKLVQPKK